MSKRPTVMDNDPLYVLRHKDTKLYLTLQSYWRRNEGWLNNHPELTSDEIKKYVDECIAFWISRGRTLYTPNLQLASSWKDYDLVDFPQILQDHEKIEVDVIVTPLER